MKKPTQEQIKFAPDCFKGMDHVSAPDLWNHLSISNGNTIYPLKRTACIVGRDSGPSQSKLFVRSEFIQIPKENVCKECRYHLLTGGKYVKLSENV